MTEPQNEPSVHKVVLCGCGVSGLTTAYRLLKAGVTKDGRRIEAHLLEGRDRLGGNIRTEKHEGYVIDGGPDAWVVTKPHASALARELGLGDRLIGTTPENRRVFVLDHDEVHPFPEGMLLTVPTQVLPFLRTRLLSSYGKARAGLDLVLPRRKSANDESIASFIRRRFGDEVLQKIAAPLLGGVFAGDVETLSMRSTFPQLIELERKHRSLILGARRDMRARKAAQKSQQKATSRPGGAPAKNAAAGSVFHSFPNGLAEFIDALAEAVKSAGATVTTETRVARIEKLSEGSGARFRVHTESAAGPQTIDCDSVILAMQGYAAADALRDLDPEMATDLWGVPYSSSAVVGLAYSKGDVAHRLDATGIITTSEANSPIKAVTFLSSKWAGRAPRDGALFRVFMGGAGREDALAMSDASLISLAEKELSKLVGARGSPVFARVYRHERASAQPVLGHEQRVARIRAKEQKWPGLFVVGAAMDGVGIPDCVRQATDLAERALKT